MSKKSYKRHQNRLYREIKRRIEAENRIKVPLDISVCERPIEKFGVIQHVPNEQISIHAIDQERSFEEMIKRDMAYKICDDLLQKGYFAFSSSNGALSMCDYQTIRAELNAVRPGEGFW